MTKVLTKSGAAVRAQDTIYKAVVQMEFMYGSESWVLMGSMLTILESFHHRVAKQIASNTAQSDGYGGWEWLPV